ncbi:hypothetical protein QQ045_014515 [Rhodiola kirilowii]
METELPEDVIEDILLRLPIELLIKFKTVSKQWLRLITSDRFAFKQHQVRTFDDPSSSSSFFVVHNHFITPVSVAVECGSSALSVRFNNPKIDLPYAAKTVNWPMHELFPAGFGIYFLYEQRVGTVSLWNPTTRETKVLPPSPYYLTTTYRAYNYNFGTVDYKDGNFSYKVCRVTSQYANWIDPNTRQDCLSLELYSSETKSWKLIPNFCSGQFLGCGDCTFNCVNLNGRAHWLIRPSEEDIFINTFDYQTEVFRRVRAPSASRDYDKRRCIVTLFNDKFLCLLLIWGRNNKEFVDIWVMHEYGVEDSWIKEFTVGPIPMDMLVVGFSTKVAAIFLRPMNNISTQLILFHGNSSKTKRHCPKGEDINQYMQVVEYTKSLVSVSE